MITITNQLYFIFNFKASKNLLAFFCFYFVYLHQQFNFMNIINKNKRATFEYSVLERYTAGIMLMGTEVKSIKESNVSISEAYCFITNNEIFISGMHIADYKKIQHTNHTPVRDRKLLLNKTEIKKLSKGIKEKGLTIIPLTVFLSETGLIKIELALVKGKKVYDKRESIKERDQKRESERIN